MPRRAAIKDKRPTKAAKHKLPGRVPSLCHFSRTMEIPRTARLKSAWKAREASMGRDEGVVVMVYGVGSVWDAWGEERRRGDEKSTRDSDSGGMGCESDIPPDTFRTTRGHVRSMMMVMVLISQTPNGVHLCSRYTT
jgi:hypothetical protein